MTNPLDDLITRNDIADFAANEGLILDDEERISVLEAMHSIDVQACPGSGKTTLIAAKLILLAKKWPLQHQGICVLSHTNVAKNEIIHRLKYSKTLEAQRLLSYPHFIGTIQEFVNRFLALPAVRNSGNNIKFLEGEDGVKEVMQSGEKLNSIYSSLYYKCGGTGSPWPLNRAIYDQIMQYLGSLFWLNSDRDLAFYGPYGNLITYKNDLTKKVFPKLKSLKEAIEGKGNYQYRDMFVFADLLLSQNNALKSAVCSRFPYVFLDEMQDTQKFQDELLCSIFPLNEPSSIVQRFGDPDQAIFHGIGSSEKPNESFNGKSADNMDVVVHKSHRFDDGLAGKIKPFSFNEIPLETELSEVSLAVRSESHAQDVDFEHTIIVFNDDTRASVIPFFAEIVSNQFSDHKKNSDQFSVKIVGAVGNEIDPPADQLKIGHYWSGYDKKKSKTNFEEESFIEAVHYCRNSSPIDWADSYKLTVDCTLKFLRMADIRDEQGRYFSISSLREWLKNKNLWIFSEKAFIECLILLVKLLKGSGYVSGNTGKRYWLSKHSNRSRRIFSVL